MQKKLDMVLLQKQTSLDVPLDTLGANDFVDTLEPPTFQVEPNPEMDNRGGGRFSHNRPTLGPWDPELSLVFGLCSRGSDSESDFSRVLECSGWRRFLKNRMACFKPTSQTFYAATAWGYHGGPGANRSLIEKFGNMMFDITIHGEAGKRVTLTANGKGRYLATPVIATQPNVKGNYEREIIPALEQGSYIINGVAYNLLSFDINSANSVVNNPDPTKKYSGGDTEIADIMVGFTATVFQKPTLAKIPHENIYNGTRGAMNLQWGRIYRYPDLQVYAPNTVLTNVKPAENNGVKTWEIEGIFEDNDVELRVYNDTASSYSSSSASMSSDSASSSSESASVSSASTSSVSSTSY